ETVLFAEADEIVVADPLRYDGLQHYIDSMKEEFVSTNSFNLYQNKRKEKQIDLKFDILSQRKYFKKLKKQWGKPLLSKIPIEWSYGFHKFLNKETVCDENLYLFHLRFMDSKLYFNRLKERNSGQKIKNDGIGMRNAIGDQENLHYRHHNEEAQKWWEQNIENQHSYNQDTFCEVPVRFQGIF
ncbi:MAG: hypothetical protein OPY07_00005, partial [Nitrosopumilus sp.]|nr:hypothetical protein [Nitrosopumilus sp.]